MIHETHNIEFKQSWRDEYLKWVCGLGIVCDVRRHDEEAGEYIEISVDPSPYPVNYKG